MIFLAIKDVPLIFIHDTLSIVHVQHKVQAFACFSSNIVNPKPDWALLTLSLWRGKKYDSSGVSTFLYYFCKSQSKVSKIPHNALLSISDLILDNWELWDHPFNHSRVGWGQISPFAINQLYDPHTSKRWHRK